jgi:hypothetical protein
MTTVLGPIIRLQIQRSPLKVGEKPNRRYSPDGISAVESLLVTPLGISARVEERETLDVHHRAHPSGKNQDGRNGISIGFTSHYGEMERRFGAHVTPGCAGENILVATARRIVLEDVAAGLVLLDAAGREKGRLADIHVATPCRPFAGFAHRYQTVDAEVLKETLQFLDGGTRGFYCSLEPTAGHVALATGDWVGLTT